MPPSNLLLLVAVGDLFLTEIRFLILGKVPVIPGSSLGLSGITMPSTLSPIAKALVDVSVPHDGSIGTGSRVSLAGKSRFAEVIDGGSSSDTIYLTSNSDAFFLDDHFSQFHPEAVTNGDFKARFASVERVLGGSGDDILDCSSEIYSLSQLNMQLDGGGGDDILWSGQGNDTLNGGSGNDVINGSEGDDLLTGGSGADIFEFTATSGNDTITDFNKDEDELHFYFRVGEAEESAVASINNGIVTWDAVTIDLKDSSLALSDLNIGYEMV
jgi:Ca2+-binding RTX toxin-like protein